MKKLFTVLVVVGFMAMAGTAIAGNTADVNVSATVTGECGFDSGGSVTFTLNPSSREDASGTVVQPIFWCSKGTSYTISDNNGDNREGTTYRMKHESADGEYIPYSFTYTAGGEGQGQSNKLQMNIASSVAAASYINAKAGGYSDKVTLSITP
jgi:spore coat protein U-like protein